MRLSLNRFIWRSHQQVYGIEWINPSTCPKCKASEDLAIKDSF